jgi:hypothetical protein
MNCTDWDRITDRAVPYIATIMAIDLMINVIKFLNWALSHVRIV